MPATSIEFTCRNCGQEIEIERSAAGMRVDCPACGEKITVPLLTERKKETVTTPLQHLYKVLEDYHKEMNEIVASGLDLNATLLTGTKHRMQDTLGELITVAREVTHDVDAYGCRIDMSVDWPPKVSISLDFRRTS